MHFSFVGHSEKLFGTHRIYHNTCWNTLVSCVLSLSGFFGFLHCFRFFSVHTVSLDFLTIILAFFFFLNNAYVVLQPVSQYDRSSLLYERLQSMGMPIKISVWSLPYVGTPQCEVPFFFLIHIHTLFDVVKLGVKTSNINLLYIGVCEIQECFLTSSFLCHDFSPELVKGKLTLEWKQFETFLT